MSAQELRKLLEHTEDKLSIFASVETLRQYNFNASELYELITDFLSDEEKLTLFNYPHFQKFNGSIRCGIIGLISDENMILQILSNDTIMDGVYGYQVLKVLQGLSDTGKEKVLRSQELLARCQLGSYEIGQLINSLPDEAKSKILVDEDLVTNVLKLESWEIVNQIKVIASDDIKKDLIDKCKVRDFEKASIILTFNNSNKVKMLLEDERLVRYDRIHILSSLDMESLADFFKNHKEFCKQNNICPYEIIKECEPANQTEFVSRLEEMDLDLDEKREILAVLKEEVKQGIDTTNFPEEYKMALSVQTVEGTGRVVLDLDRNLEDYRGLDNLMRINPEEFTPEQRKKFTQLCDICPNMEVISLLDKTVAYTSSAAEYKEGEEWISSIVDNLDPKYTKAQKLAIIDNAVGKRISYSPDFDTEVFDTADCRALWKIISSGYGVCNGIARVEQYILERAGIESEHISSGSHAFLKIKNIELPLANGETVTGDTILDPTWNLAMNRYGGKPNNFCISYEQAREHDIDDDGKDHNCHKNDEKLQDVTLGLDEQSLRELFKSVGLANEDGSFPAKDLLEKSDKLHELYKDQPEEDIAKQFQLLSENCPEFATCQNSSMAILSGVLLDNEKFGFNRCVVDRVYQRSDEGKRPVLYVYIDSNELGKKFYFADKEQGQFLELPQEEFVKQFECYDRDLEKHKGLRPWEQQEKEEEKVDLSRSSGKIVAEEGEER